MDAKSVDMAPIDDTAHQDRPHDAGQEDEIVPAVEPELGVGILFVSRGGRLLAVVVGVEHEVEQQQNDGYQEHVGNDF